VMDGGGGKCERTRERQTDRDKQREGEERGLNSRGGSGRHGNEASVIFRYLTKIVQIYD